MAELALITPKSLKACQVLDGHARIVDELKRTALRCRLSSTLVTVATAVLIPPPPPRPVPLPLSGSWPVPDFPAQKGGRGGCQMVPRMP